MRTARKPASKDAGKPTFRTVGAIDEIRTGTFWTATSHVTEKIVWKTSILQL